MDPASHLGAWVAPLGVQRNAMEGNGADLSNYQVTPPTGPFQKPWKRGVRALRDLKRQNVIRGEETKKICHGHFGSDRRTRPNRAGQGQVGVHFQKARDLMTADPPQFERGIKPSKTAVCWKTTFSRPPFVDAQVSHAVAAVVSEYQGGECLPCAQCNTAHNAFATRHGFQNTGWCR